MKNAIVFVVFVLFAAIQLNDPDPLLWVTLYLIVAAFALLTQLAPKPFLKPTITAYQVMLLVYALFYIPSFVEFLTQPDKIELVGQMKAESPWIEGTRELFGLLIAVAALGFLKKPAPAQPAEN